jgi:putative beta-barrel porin BBP2
MTTGLPITDCRIGSRRAVRRLGWLGAGLVWAGALVGSQAAEYLTPNDVVLPSETAARETVAQSAGKTGLRFLGLDVFPHAAVSGMYDDNVLITHTNPISDFEWTLLPGVTAVAGDVSTAFPGSVTLEQLRDLLRYSLVDDSDKPSRFAGLDFTPGINLFTDHSEFNNVDYYAGLTAGYTFSKLAIGLDQDYSRVAIKDNEIGNRVTRILFDTKLQARYQLTDRTLFEVGGRYIRSYYGNSIYQGYQEFRNEDWVDRRVGGKLDLGLGGAFGFVYPDINPNQTYQQALVRGSYQISGKLDVRSYLGLEVREYDGGISDTLDPVFNLALIYQVRPLTTFTLEAHRQDQPSPEGSYNYKTLGFSGGVRQRFLGRLSASLSAGYDNVDYVQLSSTATLNRSDNYYSVRAGLDYEVDQHLTTSLFYIFQGDTSNVERFTYANNLAGLRVAWRY